MTGPPRRPRRPDLALLLIGAASLAGGRARADGEHHTEFFPLPLYATSPAEGSTYGVLPVFMRVDETGRTTSIWAPSASYNSSAKFAATFRYYRFPSITRAWTVIASASTHENRSLRLEYRDFPGYPWRTTLEVQALARKNIFYRFYGLGPDTMKSDQSSYVRELGLLSVRGGINMAPHFNLGLRAGVRWDKPLRGTVQGLPSTQDRYPGAPGLDGAALATGELSVRFDNRLYGDYDVRGVASEAHFARDFGFDGGVSVWRLTWHTRVLVPEASWVNGAAHLYWTDESGGENVPFYYQSAIGGDTLFRGFTDDRFIDHGAWVAEAEQRFKIFTTDWFHVHADWRIDPFVGVGQVYPYFGKIVSHVRPVGGIGLRAFVHPTILGRVDLAYSSDGFAAYVILGYPY
jgi:hypothetical protein